MSADDRRLAHQLAAIRAVLGLLTAVGIGAVAAVLYQHTWGALLRALLGALLLALCVYAWEGLEEVGRRL